MNAKEWETFSQFVVMHGQGDYNVTIQEDKGASHGMAWACFDAPDQIILSTLLKEKSLFFALETYFHERQHWKFQKAHNLPIWAGGDMIGWVEELFCQVHGLSNAITAYWKIRMEER